MNLQMIAAPFVGGIIGLITNGLAIRMLFRPHNEIKIGKFRIPFTPGLIPKEKGRIATSIGRAVGNELLDKKTIIKALCSEEMKKAFYQKFDLTTRNMKDSQKLLKEYLKEKGFQESIEKIEGDISKKAGIFLADKMVEENVSMDLLDYAMEEITSNLNPMIMAIAGGAIETAKIPISVKIDNMILEKCPKYIEKYIDSSFENWMEKPINEIIILVEEKFPKLKDQIWKIYETFVEKKAGDFIEQIDIPKVIEEKIKELDIMELENMIMDISKKELNALVWLGGFLGMLMGFVNLLF